MRSLEELIGPDPSEIDFEKLTQAQLEAIAGGLLPAELSPTGRAIRFSFETELPDLSKLSPEELSYVARTA